MNRQAPQPPTRAEITEQIERLSSNAIIATACIRDDILAGKYGIADLTADSLKNLTNTLRKLQDRKEKIPA